MDCSRPGLLVPHHHPEFAQVHFHSISDAIQTTSSSVWVYYIDDKMKMENRLLNLAMVATAWAVWWSCGNKSSVFDKGTRGIEDRVFPVLSNYEIWLTVEGDVEGFAFGLKKLRACLYASSLNKIRSSKFWWGYSLTYSHTIGLIFNALLKTLLRNSQQLGCF